MEDPERARAVSAVTHRFRQVAERVVDGLLETAPETATALGDHRFDDRLDDLSPEGVAGRADVLRDALQALDGVDADGLDAADRADLEILRTAVAADLWRLEELREHEHDPLIHLPGEGLYPLVARDTGEPAARAAAVAARLAAVPHRLDVARAQLHAMSRVHVETAMSQARGVVDLLGDDLEALLERVPGARSQVDAVRPAAAAALEEFARWLESRLPDSDADPRLGEQRFAAKLWYTLDTETSPDVLLTRAESDLQAVEEEIAEVAAEIAGAPPRPGQVREVLDRLAAQAPVTDATILPLCRAGARPLDGAGARAGSRHRARRPGRDRRDAGVPPRGGGRLLRSAGPARAARPGRHSGADPVRGRPHAAGLAGAARSVVLPRVQRPHAAEPHRPRGDARPRAAARARRAAPWRYPGAVGVPQRAVRRGLGGLRRGAGRHGRARALRAGRRRRGRRVADATAQDAAAGDDQRDPRRPRARPRDEPRTRPCD